jgi:hypothetical protein
LQHCYWSVTRIRDVFVDRRRGVKLPPPSNCASGESAVELGGRVHRLTCATIRCNRATEAMKNACCRRRLGGHRERLGICRARLGRCRERRGGCHDGSGACDGPKRACDDPEEASRRQEEACGDLEEACAGRQEVRFGTNPPAASRPVIGSDRESLARERPLLPGNPLARPLHPTRRSGSFGGDARQPQCARLSPAPARGFP